MRRQFPKLTVPRRSRSALWAGCTLFVALIFSSAAVAQNPPPSAGGAEKHDPPRDRAVSSDARYRIDYRADPRTYGRYAGPRQPAVTWRKTPKRRVVVKPKRVKRHPVRVAPRIRYNRNVRVYRPYGPTIYGYGFHYADESAFPWLAFTALTLILLDNLNEEQIRYHEHAQIQAATAPIGEMIIWDYEGASGNVTALREGTDSRGNQCREFRQSVTIGNQIEEAYGIACLQPDGAWQMVQ